MLLRFHQLTIMLGLYFVGLVVDYGIIDFLGWEMGRMSKVAENAKLRLCLSA